MGRRAASFRATSDPKSSCAVVKSAGPGHCIILGSHLLRLTQLAVIAVAAVLAKSPAGVPLRCTMSLRNACGMFTLVIWMHVLLRGLG